MRDELDMRLIIKRKTEKRIRYEKGLQGILKRTLLGRFVSLPTTTLTNTKQNTIFLRGRTFVEHPFSTIFVSLPIPLLSLHSGFLCSLNPTKTSQSLIQYTPHHLSQKPIVLIILNQVGQFTKPNRLHLESITDNSLAMKRGYQQEPSSSASFGPPQSKFRRNPEGKLSQLNFLLDPFFDSIDLVLHILYF